MLYLNGHWQMGHGPALSKYDPVAETLLWQGNTAYAQDVEYAVEAARQAFGSWAKTSLTTRIALVQRFAEQLQQHHTHLAQVMSQETSKPFWETQMEVHAMIAKVQISIEAYHLRSGASQTTQAQAMALLQHRPHGVLAVFGPYNFPGHLPNGHIIPALIAGNCVLFKPSELTPWTAQETVKLWQQAGVPDGVLQLLQGAKTTGQLLMQQPDVDGILFTGSSKTGILLHQHYAGQPQKMLALEMGGNNALIVDAVVDVDAAVYITVQSAFLSAGQRCTCARRLLVRRGEAGDRFIQRLLEVTQQLRIGAWDAEPAVFMGGVISLTAVQQLLQAQQDLIQRGASVLLPMQQLHPQKTLLTAGILELSGIQDLPDEEYFGPLLCITRYDDFDEAIQLANQSRFGLAVGLVSPEPELFERLRLEARAGIVNWNMPLTGASSRAPFGGIGASGNHRASAWYAADYCAWPMSSLAQSELKFEQSSPGMHFPAAQEQGYAGT
jgi:succinylglutamic semialdehyde dehydrogenase